MIISLVKINLQHPSVLTLDGGSENSELTIIINENLKFLLFEVYAITDICQVRGKLPYCCFFSLQISLRFSKIVYCTFIRSIIAPVIIIIFVHWEPHRRRRRRRRRNGPGATEAVSLKINENPSTFLINYTGYAHALSPLPS